MRSGVDAVVFEEGDEGMLREVAGRVSVSGEGRRGRAYGWSSIWFTAGLIRGFEARRRLVLRMEKLEMPILGLDMELRGRCG